MKSTHTKKRRRIVWKLRGLTLLFFATSLAFLVANVYLAWRLLDGDDNKEMYSVRLMKETINEMQGMNEKAVQVMTEVNNLIMQEQQEIYQNTLAGIIVDYFYDQGTERNYFDCLKIIKCAQKYAPEPFSYQDMLTIAWVESAFDPKAVGKFDERGVWQILRWQEYLSEMKARNPHDIEVNCQMASIELAKKYEWKKDYKSAIIAYNGWITKNGMVSEKYWLKFTGRKKEIEKFCKKAEKRIRK